MNIVLSRLIVTRPSTDVVWGFKTCNFKDMHPYVKENYFNTGKLLVRGITMSDDMLILVSASQWRSEIDRLNYNQDPVIQEKHKSIRKFWKENNIKASWENTEFKDGSVIRKWQGILVE